MDNKNQSPQRLGKSVHFGVLILLAPTILGSSCSFFPGVDRGLSYFLNGFGLIAGLVGIPAAILSAIIATIWHYATRAQLIAIWIEIAATILIFCVSAFIFPPRNPFT